MCAILTISILFTDQLYSNQTATPSAFRKQRRVYRSGLTPQNIVVRLSGRLLGISCTHARSKKETSRLQTYDAFAVQSLIRSRAESICEGSRLLAAGRLPRLRFHRKFL